MSKRANDAVLIQLRNFNECTLEEESDKEDGKGPTVEEILKAQDKATHWWNTFFIMVCAFAVFIDPLFCYIHVIKKGMTWTCISYDQEAVWTYFGLRMAIDVFYVIDIIIFLCGICKKRQGKKKFGACCWKPRTEKKLTVISLKQLIKRWCLLSILPRILVALPIPEGLLVSGLSMGFDPIYAIFVIVPFQYTLRIFLIYGSRRWRPIKETTTGRWLKPLLDFLPFILASHLFGALWYRLAIQRQIDCWKPYCEAPEGGRCTGIKDFTCANWDGNIEHLQKSCPTDSEDKNVFDFGIYFYALQSNSTGSFHLSQRISQSFWWALRNLSSFGSNLPTSMHTLEIFFSIVISISGMALFLVYLNARVKESQARFAQLKLKERKHLMKPDIDLWLSKNVFKLKTMTKDSEVLKKRNKKKKALKTVIIENIHKLEENRAIDVQNIIFILPIKYRRSVKRLLCLASLRKVPMLANMNEKMLKVICEHLKPVIYIEDNYIVKEGKPLTMMLFITQGIAYTIGNNDGVETSCGSSPKKWLKRGDYYGEELLNRAFKCPSYSDLPISTRTVMSQEKIEGFALRASDLKNIVSTYWWHFSRKLPEAELEQWENLAASSLQAAWCSWLARARHLNGRDKIKSKE